MTISLVLIFLIGLCVGSFLNVVIDRVPVGASIVHGRSHCDFCKKTLAWYDLIPVFSYVFLLGKCRYCGKKLSVQYPLVELLTGILFATVFFLEQPVSLFSFLSAINDMLLLCAVLALTVMDIKYHLLPDILLLFFLFFSVFHVVVQAEPVSFRLLVGFLSMLPLLLLFLFSKGKGMGFGDVKLSFILGFLLGWPSIFIAYYIAFLTGALSGIILIIAGKKKFFGGVIPFGPFLFLGAVVAFFWGDILWMYAQRLLGF